MNALFILLSFVMYGFFVVLIRKGCRNHFNRYLSGTSGFILIFATGFFLISDFFSGAGINEAVIYHLRVGFGGAGFKEYKGIIFLALFCISLSFLTFFVALRLTVPDKNNPFYKNRVWIHLVLIMAFAFHPATHSVLKLYATPVSAEVSGLSFESFYKKPIFTTKPEKSKNLVYIYAESMERTYFDENLFPGLITGLKKLEKKGLSFTQIAQLDYGEWTIAGMVCSQCGVPLYTPSEGNAMSGMDKFLKGATCVGDILSAEGYHLVYMGGASLEFAGKGNFYQTHGFTEISGREELLSTIDDKVYQNGWGLYDDTLLESVYKRFVELSESGKKFGLFTLTLDTHHPEGHLSDSCKEMLYQDGENPILNTVHCSDVQVSELVEKMMASPYFKDTMIVIGSDHLAINNTARDQLVKRDRKNLLIVINSDRDQPQLIDREGSLLDIGPTVLTLLGYETPALGLGRNLLNNDEPTLITQCADINKKLNGWASEIKALWENPRIGSSIRIDAVRKQLQIEDRIFDLPILLTITEKGDIKNIFFDAFSSRKLKSYVRGMDAGETILWIDSAKVLPFSQNQSADESPYGVFFGKIGSPDAFIARVSDEMNISGEEISKQLTGSFSEEMADLRRKQLQQRLHKAFEISLYKREDATGHIVIHSQGFSWGESYLESLDSRFTFQRGISLVGITDLSKPVLLSHIDPCETQEKEVVAEPFRETMNRLSAEYALFAIVVHDSLFCEGSDLTKVFEGLALEKIHKVQFREPYIAIVSKTGEKLFEEGNEVEGSIRLTLNNFWLSTE